MRNAALNASSGKQPARACLGTVLVVEDEPALLTPVSSALAQAGYSVFGASSAEDALAVAACRGDMIQVLLTDVSMPRMGGLELAGKLRRLLPHVKPIFMSGSFGPDIASETPFLFKPFLLRDLLRAVQDRIPGAGRTIECRRPG
ncbi:MAG TPA: response regulator [Candidatus Acidoferrales bacterium]|nr:response regulator [Candidatus Acidoferrales bacterium]